MSVPVKVTDDNDIRQNRFGMTPDLSVIFFFLSFFLKTLLWMTCNETKKNCKPRGLME